MAAADDVVVSSTMQSNDNDTRTAADIENERLEVRAYDQHLFEANN